MYVVVNTQSRLFSKVGIPSPKFITDTIFKPRGRLLGPPPNMMAKVKMENMGTVPRYYKVI